MKNEQKLIYASLTNNEVREFGRILFYKIILTLNDETSSGRKPYLNRKQTTECFDELLKDNSENSLYELKKCGAYNSLWRLFITPLYRIYGNPNGREDSTGIHLEDISDEAEFINIETKKLEIEHLKERLKYLEII